MLSNFHIGFFILNIVILVQGADIYTIVAPGTLHPHFKYNVVVSVHRAEGPCVIEVGITSPRYNISKIINMLPMSMEIVEFETMKLERDDYKLTVKGISGITIDNSTNLNFANYDPLVFIQTDKPAYKPGELVQFRILFLNEYAHPEVLKKAMYVAILNDAYNPVKIWRNISLIHGVYTGNFQLSDIALNSKWYIEVSDGEKKLQTRTFTINKFEIPKFDISVDVPTEVAMSDEVYTIAVRSKYTSGKPVKGKAYITIQTSHKGEDFITKKTIAIDGKGYLELNTWKDLPKTELINATDSLSYNIYVTVEEALTGNKQTYPYRLYFYLYKHNFVIAALNSPKKFQPGKLIRYMLSAKKFDDTPIQDNENPVELRVKDSIYHSFFNENGIATFNFMLPEADFDYVNIYSKYRNTTNAVDTLKSETKDLPPERFRLTLITQNPQLNKDLLIEVKWTESINYFNYIVTARGNIVKAERIEVPNDTKSYTIKILPTLEMIPEAKILVQYIYNDNLRFEEKTFEIEKDFQNTLKISTVAQASPGDDIEFKISTDPNSYVGLLGVDQSVMVLGSDHDFKKKEIFHGLAEYKTVTPPLPGKGRYPGILSGLVTLTNAHFKFFYPFNYCAASSNSLSNSLRTQLPATWIFENFNITNQTEFSFVKKIPDTITSWVITGFSMNAKTGIALTKSPTKVQVFKPFFISINLPYSVKQGEVISISVLIFNYMNDTIDAEVIMENSDKEYEFVEATNEIEERPIDETKRIKRSTLSSDSVKSVSFMIKPKIIGVTTIKVTALTALAGDIVHRRLKVEPEGITQFKNNAFFINLNDKHKHMDTVMVNIPDNVVPNSERIELSAIGDLVGLSIKFIENLVRLPIGTGEQNMIHFVPSIFVLRHLKITEQKLPNVTKAALNILQTGYQRVLNFRLNDGSYSSYSRSDIFRNIFASNGNSEIVGSTWLTAYIVKYLQQASEFIDTYRPIIMKSLDFLASKQTENGSFAEDGNFSEFSHLNNASLTAFVLLSFIEIQEYSLKYETHIKKAISFLIKEIDDTDDIYALSITALVLERVKHPYADKVLTKLKSFAKNEDGFTWWSSDSKEQKRQKSHAFRSSDIEVTSYALQTILVNGTAEDVLPIIKWLTMQRNSNGGLTSTQDTVVGLEALARFAWKTGLARAGATSIDYESEGVGVDDKGTIMITPESLMALNTHELPKNTRKVSFTAKGNSSSLVQLSYSYNTIDKEPDQEFRLNITLRPNAPPKKLLVDICAQFVPSDVGSEENKTNMIVIEVTLPSGYTTGRKILEKIRDFKTILFTETKKSNTMAIIYLQSLEVGNEKCISVEATKEYEVAKQKPVPVVLYDYHYKERSATEYYEIKTSLCDICEGDDCAVGCKKGNETTEFTLEATEETQNQKQVQRDLSSSFSRFKRSATLSEC